MLLAGLAAAPAADAATPPVVGQPFPTLTAPTGIAGGVASAAVESLPAYVPQTSCDPSEKPGIAAFKKLVLAQYPGTNDWGSSRNCSDDGISEHLEGRAWDWNADVKNAAGFVAAANVLQWLTVGDGYQARRLGIMYIIYNHRIWGAYSASQGWRALNPTSNPHTDHVHFSFTWNGATKNTSFWTGVVASQDYGPCQPYVGQPAPIRGGRNPNPCPTAPALPTQWKGATMLWRGTTGALVTAAQVKLGVSPTTGSFGPVTQSATITFQRRAGLPLTGAVDAQTWFALGMGTPGTTTTIATASKATLRLGMSGKAVKRLQRALGMAKKDRTGYYGAKTKRAVKRWQRAHGRKANGVADAVVRARLGV
jgi:hypothetical protein